MWKCNILPLENEIHIFALLCNILFNLYLTQSKFCVFLFWWQHRSLLSSNLLICNLQVAPPPEVVTSLPVPSTSSISFHPIKMFSNRRQDGCSHSEPEAVKFPVAEIPYSFQLDHVSTLFAKVSLSWHVLSSMHCKILRVTSSKILGHVLFGINQVGLVGLVVVYFFSLMFYCSLPRRHSYGSSRTPSNEHLCGRKDCMMSPKSICVGD